MPQQVHDILEARQPDRLVIEISNIAGWIHDIAQTLDIEVEVDNPTTEGWQWKKIKRKTDREDVKRLALAIPILRP